MRITTLRKVLLAAAVATAPLLGVSAATALAGVATSEGGTARFVDAAGTGDRLSVRLRLVEQTPDVDPPGWSVTFLAIGEPAVTWGPGCTEGFVGAVCPFGASPPGALAVDLGAGDDALELGLEVEAAGAPTRIQIRGGAGNDQIATVRARAEIDGGEGNDVIGPDERSAQDFPPGPTPGGVIRGGPGLDTVDYEAALDPIDVSLDGVANDGRRGERDNVLADVESIVASNFGGTLIGSKASNGIVGGGGGDRLVGRAGRDTLEGRSGDDTIDALDGAGGDRVDCGEGADTALVDAGDVVVAGTVGAAGCERLTWAPGIGAAKLRYRGGRIAVPLSCPRAASSCRGRLLLRSTANRPRLLARASYRIRRGQRATLRLRPTKAGRSLLRGRRPPRAELLVQPRGTTVATGRGITIRR